MEREAVVRAVRRRQVAEALEEEREREAVLSGQLENVIAEADGPRLDEQVFSQMDPADAELVRETLDGSTPDDFEADFELELDPMEDDATTLETEIDRLTGEIALARRRIHALERYLEVVDAGAV